MSCARRSRFATACRSWSSSGSAPHGASRRGRAGPRHDASCHTPCPLHRATVMRWRMVLRLALSITAVALRSAAPSAAATTPPTASPLPVLHGDMAHEAKLRLLAIGLAVEPALRIGRARVRFVAAFLLVGTSKNRRFPPRCKSDSRFSCSERGELAWDSLVFSI